MNDTQYLVTVFHTKKRLLIQHLTSGTINNAVDLAEAICAEIFKNRRKHLIITIIEISGREYNLCNWDKKVVTRKRNIDNDEVICQSYRNFGRIIPQIRLGFHLVNIGSIDEVSDECFYDRKTLQLVQNKVSGKSITYIDAAGNESKVDYLHAHKTSWFGGLELDGEPKITKLCRDKKLKCKHKKTAIRVIRFDGIGQNMQGGGAHG